MRILALAEAHLDAVLSVQQASPEAAQWSREAYRPHLAATSSAPETLAVVAAQDGVVAGFLLARRAADELEILNLAVAPANRRAGIGSRLVERALHEAELAGAVRIFLEVRESNRAAERFYARHGFQVAGRRSGYYTAPSEDALVLARLLLGVRRGGLRPGNL